MSQLLHSISLTQFRNYKQHSFRFPAAITCITGANGSGKTNLLDAVYVLCYTKSYFSATQQNLIMHYSDGYRVSGNFHKENGSEETIVCKWKDGKKEVFADEIAYEKITDHIGHYAAVMIAPDDLQLINEGSEQRRKWLDSILCQTDKTYFEQLIKYQRVLQQRNAWLKLHVQNPPSESAELDFYNTELAQTGQFIFEARKQFMQSFLPLLEQYYTELSDAKEHVNIVYQSDLSAKPFLQTLQETLQYDFYRQRTNRGIHKDELVFFLDANNLKPFGSQGQKKTFLFAMKLAQYAYLKQQFKQSPILLLDDIFEKLDQSRIEALMRMIAREEFGQVLLTDTHAARVKASFGNSAEIAVLELQ